MHCPSCGKRMQTVKHPGGATDAICLPCTLRAARTDLTGPGVE